MHKLGVLRLAVALLSYAAFLPAGVITATVTLESSFNVTQSYIDNLFFEPENTKSDFGTLVGPNLTLRYDNPDIVLGATYVGRIAFFVKNPNQNTYIQNANIILDLPFLTKRYKGLTVNIDETMNFTPQLNAFALSGALDTSNIAGITVSEGVLQRTNRQETTETPGFPQGVGGTQGVFTSRASAFVNRAGITFGYDLLPRFSPSLQYLNLYNHFFSSGFQDFRTHTGTMSLPYQVTRQTTVGPSYSYTQTEFLGQSTQNTSADKIFTHTANLGISHAFTQFLIVSVDGGVAFSKQKNALEDNRDLSNKWQTTYIGGFSIVKTYDQNIISLVGRQIIGSGGGLAAQATRTRVITGAIRHRFDREIQPYVSIGYAENDSIDGNAFDTQTYQIQAGLVYAFKYWLLGNLSYSHIDQRSKGSAATDLTVNQIFIGLTAFADPWVLLR
jgi:hypothetical protein